MKITFMSIDRSETLELPIVPPDQTWDNGKNNLTMETLEGELSFYGKNKLTTLSIQAFFPMREYSWALSPVKGDEAVGFFSRYKNEEKPLRMIISNKKGKTLLNILVAIDNFNHGYDRIGDIPYTLDLTEFIAPNISPTITKQLTTPKPNTNNANVASVRYLLRSGSYATKKDAQLAVNKIVQLNLAKKEYMKIHSKSSKNHYWETGTYNDKKTATTNRQKIISSKIAKIVTIVEVK